MVKHYDVLIVGAGASGIGIGILLKQMGCESFCIVDKGTIGETFRRWPIEMRFITPSFPAQGFGQTDLNAIAPKTSPAYTLDEEHPTGEDYAEYLDLLVDHYALPVEEEFEVYNLNKRKDQLFEIETSKGDVLSKYVIWAAGEYQYPAVEAISGAEHCLHSSQIQAWEEMDSEQYIVIGGYESGVDAVCQLDKAQKSSTLIAKTPTWEIDSSDPSTALTPYTYKRLRKSMMNGRIELVQNQTVVSVEKKDDKYHVYTQEGKRFTTSQQPILATGFKGSTSRIPKLFQFGKHGEPLVNEKDESTKCNNLFLAGPELRHGSHVFCYIYKFRQRFAVVAEEIATRLALNTEVLEMYQKENFYLYDLSNCGERCEC
ncbi:MULTISPECIES: NAD(P)/FAD-dependent oxidoreductase [Oceanobacillus]|uniref:Monooxygenase n=1 Tax=Oceanobacillus kimchii TaxID=746691 RepID=A0ABQ5TMY2_9BACI|nr:MULTISPECIES: NAD(P)/FAD-dependent oxidoreductase [Oceanobacillus]MBT2599959.1 NAD(P)-binding domain-containing protein [Oceanobacillus sp. ISL-74]MBT2652591.1 NAD(P)-binding domain-containing protein [Oceanobacillus sp. ISL-73]OEH56472.1 hypothetical protein AQ616_02840 [Oceanobacillus sp. E9]GLO68168.1 monooxygenase [Oceanobacillus kimchii]